MRDFATGVRMLGQGFGIVFRTPKLLLMGALPALLTTLLWLAGLVLLVLNIGTITDWITPFADSWATWLRWIVRFVAGVLVIASAVAIGMVAFAGLTLAIGGPFYEAIAEAVEEQLGGAEPPATERGSWFGLFFRGLRDAIALVVRSICYSVLLAIAGFIPVLGQTVVPVLVVLVGAWMLSVELVAVSCYRRGLGLAEQRKVLRGRKGLALGLGLPVYLLCLVPLLSIVVLPGAFAAGTLVAREVLRDRVAQPAA